MTHRDLDDEPWPIPVEQPGPPPRRHLKPMGKWIVFWFFVGLASLAFTLVMCVPGPYGPSPG